MPNHNAFGLGFSVGTLAAAGHQVVFGTQAMKFLKEFVDILPALLIIIVETFVVDLPPAGIFGLTMRPIFFQRFLLPLVLSYRVSHTSLETCHHLKGIPSITSFQFTPGVDELSKSLPSSVRWLVLKSFLISSG